MVKKKIVVIIPARYHASRFEGKVLVDIYGKPVIQHVYERAKMAKHVDDVIVATDDERIKNAVEKFDGKVVMTSKDHKSGTDRITEVAKNLDADIIINVQGDEPLVYPRMIEQIAQPILDDSSVNVTTLMRRIKNNNDLKNPNVVKLVLDKNSFVLYFSRSPIPYPKSKQNFPLYHQVGLYAFRRDFLLKFSKLKPTHLELTEGVELLRVLENGYKIKGVETEYESLDINVPEDVEKVKEMIKNAK